MGAELSCVRGDVIDVAATVKSRDYLQKEFNKNKDEYVLGVFGLSPLIHSYYANMYGLPVYVVEHEIGKDSQSAQCKTPAFINGTPDDIKRFIEDYYEIAGKPNIFSTPDFQKINDIIRQQSIKYKQLNPSNNNQSSTNINRPIPIAVKACTPTFFRGCTDTRIIPAKGSNGIEGKSIVYRPSTIEQPITWIVLFFIIVVIAGILFVLFRSGGSDDDDTQYLLADMQDQIRAMQMNQNQPQV